MVAVTVLTLTPIEVDFVPYSCVKNGVGGHGPSLAAISYFILLILVLILTVRISIFFLSIDG